MNNDIKKCTRKTTENWFGEQCSETEIYLRMNKSKTACQLVKDLSTVKQGKATTIQDRSGKWLTNERETMSWWTILLWAAQSQGQWRSISTKLSPDTHRGRLPFLQKEAEAAVESLKKGKSAAVDNISAELVQAGWEEVITGVKTICNKIWQTGKWPTPWTQSLVITLSKKGNLWQCQNYRTISLTSHPSKVMEEITLNRLKQQAGRIIVEEHAGLRAGRTTTEQIFNQTILCEK